MPAKLSQRQKSLLCLALQRPQACYRYTKCSGNKLVKAGLAEWQANTPAWILHITEAGREALKSK
jgi:hypothetical protein